MVPHNSSGGSLTLSPLHMHTPVSVLLTQDPTGVTCRSCACSNGTFTHAPLTGIIVPMNADRRLMAWVCSRCTTCQQCRMGPRQGDSRPCATLGACPQLVQLASPSSQLLVPSWPTALSRSDRPITTDGTPSHADLA